MNLKVNKYNEFEATKENIEELLRNGAKYNMCSCPQDGRNLLAWDTVSSELRKNLSLSNCSHINTMDSFSVDGKVYNPVGSIKNLISLNDWAAKNGIDPATARQRAGRGAFETAQKIGRNWVIDEDEKLVDHRRKAYNAK